MQQAKDTTTSRPAKPACAFSPDRQIGRVWYVPWNFYLAADNIIIEVGYLRERYTANHTTEGDAPVD